VSDPLSEAIDAIEQSKSDDITCHTAIALMRGYHDRWSNHPWKPVAVEEEFHLPLVNPDTGKSSRTFIWAGKRDARAFFEDKQFVVEHKTTSDDIQDPNSDYWRNLLVDSQVSAYALSSWQEGNKVQGTLYDVIKKPTIRPKLIEKKERAAIASLQTYLGKQVTSETQRIVIDGLDRENGELFAIRLGIDIEENPAKYFGRRTIIRMDGELIEFATELWQIGQEIRNTNTNQTHFKNSSSCLLYGRACEYLGICSGFDNPESDRWIKADNPHRELTGVPKTALTNSSIRCFQTCRRKFHYRYNLGLQRRDDEQAEALRFGSLVHVALEAWWKFFLEKNNVNGSGIAVIEAASSTAS
jgi:hypothetical protein